MSAKQSAIKAPVPPEHISKPLSAQRASGTISKMLTCRRPDRDCPKLVCGYPLPCPHHTVVIDLDKNGVPKDANDWSEADWLDLYRTMKRLIRRVAARHR